MKGGNEATNGSGVTQFAEGEPKSMYPTLCSPNGECVIPFANAHSITAFHLKSVILKRELLFKGVVEIEDVVEVVDVVAFGL